MSEGQKLEKVIKSCKAARVCARVIFIMFCVATVLTLVSGIAMIADHEKLDEQFAQNDAEVSIHVGSQGPRFLLADVTGADGFELESSVPQLQEFFDENEDSTALPLGIYCLGISFVMLIGTFAVWLVYSVFDTIVKEGNPFADRVPKRILTSMIILTVVVALSSGLGFAVLLGLLTWAVYSILDYGKELRIQSDETL